LIDHYLGGRSSTKVDGYGEIILKKGVKKYMNGIIICAHSIDVSLLKFLFGM